MRTAPMDLREGLNAISDVVVNRPAPLREFDQIYMKAADMLIQTEHASRWLKGRKTVFIGDGDAIGLCLLHLHNRALVPDGPSEITVLDFDERVLNSVHRFAKQFGIEDRIRTQLYNVADPLPEELWQSYEAFYTNPPFGASNDGLSVQAFVRRGIEATGADCIGCLVIGDDPSMQWTQRVLRRTQKRALKAGFVIAEMVPEFHRYHLDDAPELTSCSLVLRRTRFRSRPYGSEPLSHRETQNFYGQRNPITCHYVRDRCQGGKLPSRDHEIEPFDSEDLSAR